MLITSNTVPQFDLNEIHRGTLIWAKHRSWSEGVSGFVSWAKEDEILVQYPPTLRNVTNHFYIPAQEAADGQWEIRYTNDMQTLSVYGQEDTHDTETADLPAPG